jgi:hypothetical protein
MDIMSQFFTKVASKPDERDKCLPDYVLVKKKQENNLEGTKSGMKLFI